MVVRVGNRQRTNYHTLLFQTKQQTMAKAYEEFEGGDHERDEDEDIGALGSILSWDEDEEGAVGGPSSQSCGESSGLPDLVSFNLKNSGMTTLESLQAAGDAPNLNLPMPTPINFGQQIQGNPSEPQVQQQQQMQAPQAPQHRVEDASKNSNTQSQSAASTANANNAALAQQQLQQHLQQHLQQQYQQQASQQQQQQLMPQSTIQSQQNNQTQNQAQQQQQQQQAAAASAQQQAAQQAAVVAAQQGAFQLFQQSALLAQTQNAKQQPLVPGMMMSNVAQNHEGQGQAQAQAQQFQFPADPAAFLRQLQVAQLQQQFNAVQQGRAIAPQAPAQQNNQGNQAMQQQQQQQQQMQFQPNVAPAPPPAPSAAPAAASSRKKPKASSKKPPPTTSTQQRSLASRVPLVSASDTDGESKQAPKQSRRNTEGSESLSIVQSKSDIDLSNLTPEEKAKANRDRNREHARNTRLRKKAYLEKLKSTVDELCRERDTLVSERAGAANILVEMHNTRTEVLMSFFALRSANEKRRDLWASILDESCFACVMPVTPYRSFPASEVQVSKCQRTILGIDGMMADTSSLHVLLNSLVDRSRFPNATIVFRYTLVTEEAVVAGNQMMARWVMSTLNATQCGAKMEVAKQGMLCCKFNSAHKIIGLELMFDVMALMLQLKQAAGSDTFSVIPNTVQTCQRSFDKPMVMTLAEEPYTIVQVNKLWEEMTGYTAEEVVGKTSCSILEGEETKASAVEGLMNEIRFKRPASAMVVRYKKSGEKYRDFFLSYPLSTDSRITHYLHLSSHVDWPQSSSTTSPIQNQGIVQAQGSATVASGGLPSKQSQGQQPSLYGLPSTGASMRGQPQLLPPGAQQMFNLPAVLSSAVAGPSTQAGMITGDGTPRNVGTKRSAPDPGSGNAPKQAKAGTSDTVNPSGAPGK
mmetsp:Transcript_70126/g.203362  ORF Transcript_70126/g.203362 Transcript_70126/m.203362 type:complete len:921 (-) Transcript_70126:138-2900(-)